MERSLIDALDSVTWYNGLAEFILKWKDEKYLKHDDYIISWDWDKYDAIETKAREQLQVLWMICVELFGDCGTSPRTGWIYEKNKGKFYKFIDDITKTYREDLCDM